ncbi:hypothetical protein D3C87_1409750 [compost metagenome]
MPSINDESSEARNTAVLPMSEGCPILPIGITSAQYFFTASSCSAGTNLSNTGVSVVPGDITFTLILLSKRSFENPFAK